MKKTLLAAALVSVVSVASAQKPAAGAKGFTFGVTGINTVAVNTAPSSTGTLVFKYMVNDGMAARIGILYGSTKSTVVSDTINGEQTTTETKSSNIGLSLGAQKYMGDGEKLRPYFGADIVINNNGGSSEVTKEIKSTTGGGVVGDKMTTKAEKVPSSNFSLGLRFAAGFDYFFAENFAFGAEFGWGFSNSSQKYGETTTTKTGTSYGTAGTTTSTNIGSTKASGFSTSGSGTISVSVFF